MLDPLRLGNTGQQIDPVNLAAGQHILAAGVIGLVGAKLRFEDI